MILFNSKYVNKLFYCSLFILSCSLISAQDSTKQVPQINLFEGIVTYHHQLLNPNPLLISDEEFYATIPNGGKSTVTLSVKGNQYKWDYPDRIEIFIPEKNQIAIYNKASKDSVYYAPATVAEEPLEKMEKSSLTKRLAGLELTAYVVNTKWDSRVYFYHPTTLKTNPSFWKSHLRDYMSNFTQKSSCFPLMIQQKSILGNWILAMSKIEAKKLTAEDFAIGRK